MIDKYYKGNNFWECFPEFRVLDIFDFFYKDDKSKDKENSSNIMWAITFCLRKESLMYNLPDKWERAGKDIIKIKGFNWEKYDHLVQAFKQSYMTQAERSLLAWEELMAKRDKYLKTQEYFFDFIQDGKLIKGTAEQMDRAFSVTPRMYSDYAKIRKEIEDDEIKRGRGNKIKSASDADEI
jgi:hypothetical protein